MNKEEHAVVAAAYKSRISLAYDAFSKLNLASDNPDIIVNRALYLTGLVEGAFITHCISTVEYGNYLQAIEDALQLVRERLGG